MQVQQIIIIGIIFCLIHLSAGEINSALTPEERKKIVDALNKDRQEIGKQTGLNMSILTYDGTDENRFPIFSAKCILHSWYRDHVVTNWKLEAQLAGVELPPISKYADILGVTETLSEEVVMAGATEEGGAQGAGILKFDKYSHRKLVNNMAIKLVLAIICVIFSAATSNEIRAKRDLSPDVRNKLIEVLNKDRQEIGKKLNIKMEIVKYDVSLERSIVWSEDDCMKSPSWFGGQHLNGNSVAREVMESHKKNYTFTFFIPSYKTIGCSKDFKCSVTVYSEVRDEIIGKTMVLRGLCIFGEARNISRKDEDKINEADRPMPWKYGDIIGVDGPTSPEGSANVQGSGSGEAQSGKGSGAGNVFILKFDKNNHRKLVNKVTMKLFLAIICVIFCSATSNEIRAKRDLSPDVRNKLIEVLNKDRQEIGKKLNITMEIMKYDVSLERSIVWSEDDCNKTPSFTGLSTISGDSLAREVIEKYTQGYGFFIPSYKTIGCSKDFKCKDTFDSNVIDKSMIGKTAVYRGFCIFGEKWKISDEDNIKLHEAERPLPFKYAAIIGVEGSTLPEESAKDQGSGSGTSGGSNEKETVEYFGGCIFGEKVNIEELEEKLIKAGLPPISKYADLLGVEPKGSGAGILKFDKNNHRKLVNKMAMKLLLAIICVIFSAATFNEIRAKRDLSPDVRNKLIEVLNKDRQEIGKKLNIKMEILNYNVSLERSIVWSEGECIESVSLFGGQYINGDSLAREDLEKHKKSYSFGFFIPSYKTIGCSKDFKCSATVYSKVRAGEIEKTMVFRGLCIFGEARRISGEDHEKISKAELPIVWKYGDIIGADGPSGKGSGCGSVLILKFDKNNHRKLVNKMAMKLVLAIICVIFSAAISNEIRAKRDLSPDVRNKLIEVLNKDRQEIGKKLNITMEIMKYDVSLEQSIVWSEDDCMKSPSLIGGTTLGGDSLSREIAKKYSKDLNFFIPTFKTIGCSKDFKCSNTYNTTSIDELKGKTAVFRGICLFGGGSSQDVSKENFDKISNAELPMPWKYGDLIGVDGPSGEGSTKVEGSGSGEAPSEKGSGCGSVLSLIMSLFLILSI
ncbi:unnamed protein product [Caenorhabditis brenneri]